MTPATSIPEGATHTHDAYGVTNHYRRVTWRHLNQVSEEWQTRGRWDWWNGNAWVEDRFACSRNFKQITPQPIVR